MIRGFTLIELLVSIALFTVVMVVALGALLAVTESDRKAQTLKTITNNLGFALDSMSRTIRTGVDYSCNNWTAGTDCASGDILFTFEDKEGNRIGYRHRTDPGECGNTGSVGGCIQRSSNGGVTWSSITAPEVVVEDLTFYLIGAPQGDNLQPRLTITAKGYVKISETLSSEFRIQTTVTQRLYDQ